LQAGEELEEGDESDMRGPLAVREREGTTGRGVLLGRKEKTEKEKKNWAASEKEREDGLD
jgi:hypothetical protein